MAGVGRPTVLTEEVIRILEEAFSNDATDLQACFLAKISKTALYEYQKDHPEFAERKEALKAMTGYQAKKVIKSLIDKADGDKSAWYLERKAKDEGFNTRTEMTGKDGEDLFPKPLLGGASTHELPNNNSAKKALET